MQDTLTISTADAMEVSLPIAGVGGRSLAFIIDWHIRALLAALWLFGTTQLLRLATDMGVGTLFDEPSGVVVFVVLVPAMLIYFLYHPVLEVLMRGRTPGKRMAGVRTVTVDGHTPGVGPLLVRNIFRLLDSLPMFYVVGLGVAFFTSRQVRLGDLAAGTVLVYEKARGGERPGQDAFSVTQGFGQEQLELARELLERWRDLGRSTRDRLAQRILSSEGVAVAAELKGRKLDRELQQRLQSLVSGK